MNMQGYSVFQLLVFAIMAANVLLSYTAFNRPDVFNKMKFRVYDILQRKEWIRLITSAFIHVNITHLLFNMIAFWSFGMALERYINVWQLFVLYFVSMVLGSLLPLFMHKNNPNYSAVGASGAVSGVVFASILFFPRGEIIFIFLPFLPIPSWIFGIMYLLYTVYGIDKQSDNIGHEAHLGGALAGLLMAVVFRPDLAMNNWWLALVLLVVPVILLLFVIQRKVIN